MIYLLSHTLIGELLLPGLCTGFLAGLLGGLQALVFGLFVSFSAAPMLHDRKPALSRQMPGLVGQATSGSGIGFLSGLVGAGGGFYLPALVVIAAASVAMAPLGARTAHTVDLAQLKKAFAG
jgi:uncharacterized membrane protein YfcA